MYNIKYPQMKTLETKRCILRPATLKDTADLFEYYQQEKVVKFLPFNKHKNIQDTHNFIKLFFLDNYKKGKIGHFVIVSKKSKKVIGNVGFNNISQDSKEGEMGICINPSYWGNDLSTELAVEMLRFGFEDLKLNRIIAILYEENVYSKKPLEVLGFNFVGKFIRKITSTKPHKSVICYKYEMMRNNYFNN
ncbi:N-acetyltransferase [Romboutsia weinsteinii]|uniref:N-acetyltransferase n=1 Tax=Romboutsia weinsteinii TaxID=2020949 RepID=A0A371J6M6_9FIRM|nr:GNAT family N-acetyltransferase [Romboutsia weinsteinii]RDY28327.1 N-acetyltransferase [Romboutsia weinsteinii]